MKWTYIFFQSSAFHISASR